MSRLEELKRSCPQWAKPEYRRIDKCSDQTKWYASEVGKVMLIHYFCTFGAYDTNGRFLWYYDLSAPKRLPEWRVKHKKDWFLVQRQYRFIGWRFWLNDGGKFKTPRFAAAAIDIRREIYFQTK